MVRVIAAHHFKNQAVQTVEQPTACTVARNRLLSALSNQTIEVRDLSADGVVLFTFPTVDEVTQLLFCPNGNCIVTLETKHNQQNRALNFARVYVRWDSIATWQQCKMTRGGMTLGATSECGMVQPMRARIAGRVTPTTAQSELGSLEMIELASRWNPHGIAVCQTSGNILLVSQTTITIYEFRVKVHDISKLRFIDFEEFPCLIGLNFAPTKMAFAENYIACMNNDKMHMFKLVFNNKVQKDWHNETVGDWNFIDESSDECLDYTKLMAEERQKSAKDKITVKLPSIARANGDIHRSSLFTVCDKSMRATIISNSPIESRSQYSVINLIQISLKAISCETDSNQIDGQFKCLELKPLYIDEQLNRKTTTSTYKKHLKSDYYNLFNSVVCLIATQHEGYMYQFSDNDETNDDCDVCVALVYPFTAPIFEIVLEDYFLHAVTEAGLESYTVRNINELCHNLEHSDDISASCPPMVDPICLFGLRPFLGVEKLLLGENYLILLASADSSPTHSVGSGSSSSTASYWTLYSLELPSPRNVYDDICMVASWHRLTSMQIYSHLLSEAHLILRTTLLLKRFIPIEMDIGLLTIVKNNTEDVAEVYRTSCALLGDHYIMCNNEKEYQLAVPYYKVGVINPFDVLKRVKKIQEEYNNSNVAGLIYYLTVILLDVKFVCDIDTLFNMSSKQSFIKAILDLFNRHNYPELPTLILKSRAVREYSTQKLLNLLKRVENDEKPAEKSLALCILYLQRCNITNAQNYLQKIDKDELKRVLWDNWELMFEYNSNRKAAGSFSDLTTILMDQEEALLSNILIELVVKSKCLTLNKLLKAFIEYLPSSDTNSAGRVLQATIELYLCHFYDRDENRDPSIIVYDRPTHDALKLLVRSYLSQLQLLQLKEKTTNDKGDMVSNDNYLFADIRYVYLNEMPPFQIDARTELNEKADKENNKSGCGNVGGEAHFILKKLQALLCIQAIPNQVIIEVNTFLNLNENLKGIISLQSIIMTVNDGIPFLIEECPQCLLQFAKDRFSKIDEWKYLVANIQRNIIRLCQDKDQNQLCVFFKKILKDILTHVATSNTLQELMEVFPQHMEYSTSCLEASSTVIVSSTTVNVDGGGDSGGNERDVTAKGCQDGQVDILNELQNYEPYINICKETMQANQMRKLIAATGKQLLSKLKL